MFPHIDEKQAAMVLVPMNTSVNGFLHTVVIKEQQR